MKEFYKNPFLILIIMLGVFLTLGCSSGSNFNQNEIIINDNNDDGKRTFSFYEDDVHWKIEFVGDKIVSIYKDGEKIPESEIPKYEDFVSEKVSEFEDDMKEFRSQMADFKIDMNEFDEHMAKMKQELQNAGFEINFDDEQFRKDMQRLAAEIKANFNSEEFKENMHKLKEELQNMKIDIDMDEVHNQLREAREQMKNISININIDELKEQLHRTKEQLQEINFSEVSEQIEKAKKQLEGAKFDLKEAKKTLRKYKSFMREFKSELEKDKLIENVDDDFEMEFNSIELIINGKKVPDELHKKYKKMYEQHFDKQMDDDININTEK